MTTPESERETPITKEAKDFADKMYPCEEPCDSYGACEGCCERLNFDCGYRFGYDARDAEVSRLTRQLKVAKESLESAAAPTACDMHGISDSCAVNLAKQTLQEIEKIGGEK